MEKAYSSDNKAVFFVSQKAALYAWFVCGLGAVFYIYEYLLRIAPSAMTMDLMRAFELDSVSLSAFKSYYYIIYAFTQVLVGLLLDRYGPRYVLSIACLLCAVAAFMFGMADTYWAACASRLLVGFGSAFAFVGVLKLASIWLPPERFGMASGINAALGALGASVGLGIMAGYVENVGWRESVIYLGIAGVVLTVLLYLFIRDGSQDSRKAHIDNPDFNHLLTSLWRILKTPQIWIVGLIGCLIYLTTTVFAEGWAISYFESTHGFTSQQAKWLVSAIFFGFAIGGFVNGWISDKVGSRTIPLIFGGVLAAIGISIILYVPNLSYAVTYSLLFFTAFCYSVQVLVFALAHDICPLNLAGTATAVTNGLVMMGGFVFHRVVGELMAVSWSGGYVDGIPFYTAEDYQSAMIILPIGMLISVFLAFFLKEKNFKNLRKKIKVS